jgi:hypothetical protein
MAERRLEGFWVAAVWVAFPLVPAVLEDVYSRAYPGLFQLPLPPDPFVWEWLVWVVQLGPLIGFSYLVGATIDVPDVPSPGRCRGLFTRRSFWVGIGPWSGFLAWASFFFALRALESFMP